MASSFKLPPTLLGPPNWGTSLLLVVSSANTPKGVKFLNLRIIILLDLKYLHRTIYTTELIKQGAAAPCCSSINFYQQTLHAE
jgi:hypothetical protein